MPDPLTVTREFEITHIYSLYTYRYKSDYFFKSEYHEYRQLLYIRSGSIEISSSNETIILQPGQLFLEAPDVSYSLRLAGEETATVFCLGFDCKGESLELLTARPFVLTDKEKQLIALITEEGQRCFSFSLDAEGTASLEKNYNCPFGGEQLVSGYLESLLISIMRGRSLSDYSLPEIQSSETNRILFHRIVDYFEDHITDQLTIEMLCQEFSIGRAHLQRIFREYTGYPAIDYFCRMRISNARKYLREHDESLKDTASALGYHSAHYFSRQFRQFTGMTPSEYQKRVRLARSNPLYQRMDLDHSDR